MNVSNDCICIIMSLLWSWTDEMLLSQREGDAVDLECSDAVRRSGRSKKSAKLS